MRGVETTYCRSIGRAPGFDGLGPTRRVEYSFYSSGYLDLSSQRSLCYYSEIRPGPSFAEFPSPSRPVATGNPLDALPDHLGRPTGLPIRQSVSARCALASFLQPRKYPNGQLYTKTTLVYTGENLRKLNLASPSFLA